MSSQNIAIYDFILVCFNDYYLYFETWSFILFVRIGVQGVFKGELSPPRNHLSV